MTKEDLQEIAERKRVLVIITTQSPNTGVHIAGADYFQGDVVEVSGEFAAELAMNGTARPAPPGARARRLRRSGGP